VVDLLDKDSPDKPLRPISIKQSRFCVQMAASTAVASGVDVEELRSLSQLVPRECVALILNGLRQRHGRESPTPYRVATTLKAIAEHYCKVDEKEVDRLRKLCHRVLVKRRGMSPKSRQRLQPFQDPVMRDRFLLLPSELMRSAERDDRNPRQAAMLAQMTVILEIGQMAPMRAKNLANLELGRHLTFLGHGRSEFLVISIPEVEMKTEIALEYPLAPESTRLVRRYIEHHLPHLSPGKVRVLFPGRNDEAKRTHSLSTQVERIIRRSIGYRVNVHLLRHFAAMLYLQAYPGAYEAVRRLLGHATASAALDFYVGFETAAAVRHFDEVVLRQRRVAASRAKMQLGRSRRS
jgi:integrase